MAKVVAGMVMSLDGYVRDRTGSVMPLFHDFAAMRESDAVQDAMASTGSVVMGRATYDMGNGDYTGYEFQAPIFVVTHDPPAQPAKGENENLRFTFVTDGIERATSQAKAAAGSKDVIMIGGPETIGQALAAGLVDELHMDVRAVLLGGGLPMFPGTLESPIELELISCSQSPGLTNVRYRVVRA
jgi:dihydrofolate reductase